MDYYVVLVSVGGVLFKSLPMSLGQAEQAAKDFVNAAPNTSPQIVFDHTA